MSNLVPLFLFGKTSRRSENWGFKHNRMRAGSTLILTCALFVGLQEGNGQDPEASPARAASDASGGSIRAAQELVFGVPTPLSLPSADVSTLFNDDFSFKLTIPSGTTRVDVQLATQPRRPHRDTPSAPVLPVSVTIGGQNAEVQYAGGAPGQVAGLMQINARIPAGIQAGNTVPVIITVGNASSQSGVTIAIAGDK